MKAVAALEKAAVEASSVAESMQRDLPPALNGMQAASNEWEGLVREVRSAGRSLTVNVTSGILESLERLATLPQPFLQQQQQQAAARGAGEAGGGRWPFSGRGARAAPAPAAAAVGGKGEAAGEDAGAGGGAAAWRTAAAFSMQQFVTSVELMVRAALTKEQLDGLTSLVARSRSITSGMEWNPKADGCRVEEEEAAAAPPAAGEGQSGGESAPPDGGARAYENDVPSSGGGPAGRNGKRQQGGERDGPFGS